MLPATILFFREKMKFTDKDNDGTLEVWYGVIFLHEFAFLSHFYRRQT